MRRLVRPSLGLIGRLVAILLLTVTIEFGVSTLLYERASQFSVRDDEARRLAEHLVISRRLVAEQAAPARPRTAAELSTERYALRWEPTLPPPPPVAPSLDGMQRQVVAWEPALARADLRLHLASPGRRARIAGGLRLPDGTWLYFQTLQPVKGLNLATERILLALIPALALMALGGLMVRRALLPLRRLAIAADRVGDGSNETQHVPESGPGEVARVIAAFNRMQDRIHALIDDRTQALAAVGHDFRTPLSRLRLRAEEVAEAAPRAAIERDVAEMEAMVASLLAYLGGEGDPEAPVVADVAVICATLVDDAIDAGCEACYAGADHLPMLIRRLGLKRALGNLVDNAVRFGSHITVSMVETAGAVVIAVEDDGPGIDPALLDRVLEPFVRGGDERGRDTAGFGLGLAIARRMVEREGGTLRLVNRDAGGLRAEIALPRR